MKMIGHRFGDKLKLESKSFLDPVCEFHVLHRGIGKFFIKGKSSQQLGLHGEIARVKMAPVRLRTGEKQRISELHIGIIKPMHERRDLLAGRAPTGEAKSRQLCCRGLVDALASAVRPVSARQKYRRPASNKLVPQHRDAQVTRLGRSTVLLSDVPDAQWGFGLVRVHLLACSIVASVVDNHDFKINASLFFQMAQALQQGGGTIVSRNNNAERLG